MRHLGILVTVLTLVLCRATEVEASIQFFEGSGTGNAVGQGSFEQAAFQATVSYPLTTIDFESYTNGTIVDRLTPGTFNIDVQTLNAGGALGEDNLRIFAGSFGATPPGTINGKTLLNGNTVARPQLEFLFDSGPAEAFGLWVFDNGTSQANNFRMGVKETGDLTYSTVSFWNST